MFEHFPGAQVCIPSVGMYLDANLEYHVSVHEFMSQFISANSVNVLNNSDILLMPRTNLGCNLL